MTVPFFKENLGDFLSLNQFTSSILVRTVRYSLENGTKLVKLRIFFLMKITVLFRMVWFSENFAGLIFF
jgi:hypothetical protein